MGENDVARYVFRLAATLSLLLSVCMVAIRSQDFDANGDLRRLLVMPDCPTPCWAGIRPGFTTLKEVIAILENHPWISHTIVYNFPGNSPGNEMGAVYWDWSAERPAWIKPAENGIVLVRNGVVQVITFKTRIPLGSAWLLLGRPDWQTVIYIPYENRRTYYHNAVYHRGRLELLNVPACPMERLTLWQTPVEFSIQYDQKPLVAARQRRPPC
jgi:hypothetical protein